MTEILVQFDAAIESPDGRAYAARVCGRVAEDGLWEGWIEFDPRDGTPALRTPRETEQSSRTDLEYWATGLTVSYLEGALARARPRQVVDSTLREGALPGGEGPAPSAARREHGAAARPFPPRAVLNPFEVYAQGQDVLRRELTALSEDHLRSIVRVYTLMGEEELDLEAAGRPALVEVIITAVRRRAG